MTDCRKLWHRLGFSHSALVAGLILVAIIAPFAATDAAEPITLKVEAARGLPGFHHSALSRFLAAHMAEARLADWRFESEGDASARDRPSQVKPRPSQNARTRGGAIISCSPS